MPELFSTFLCVWLCMRGDACSVFDVKNVQKRGGCKKMSAKAIREFLLIEIEDVLFSAKQKDKIEYGGELRSLDGWLRCTESSFRKVDWSVGSHLYGAITL